MLFCWGFRTCSPFKLRTLFSPLTVLISSSELLSIQQARERIALHPLLGNRSWWTAVMCLWLPPALLRDVLQDCDALILRVPPSRLTCPSFKWCRVVQPHIAPPLAALQKVGISQLLCLCPRWIL